MAELHVRLVRPSNSQGILGNSNASVTTVAMNAVSQVVRLRCRVMDELIDQDNGQSLERKFSAEILRQGDERGIL